MISKKRKRKRVVKFDDVSIFSSSSSFVFLLLSRGSLSFFIRKLKRFTKRNLFDGRRKKKNEKEKKSVKGSVQNAALRELDARLYFLFLFCACSRILVVLNNKECEERFLLVEKKTVEREPSRVSHSSEKIKTSDSRLLSSDFFFFALCTFSLFFAFFSPVHVHDVIFCVWSLSLSLLNHMKKKRTKKRKNRRHLPRSFGN